MLQLIARPYTSWTEMWSREETSTPYVESELLALCDDGTIWVEESGKWVRSAIEEEVPQDD